MNFDDLVMVESEKEAKRILERILGGKEMKNENKKILKELICSVFIKGAIFGGEEANKFLNS